MNLIKINLSGETWYHSKKGLQSGNYIRFTQNIDEAQTYNNPTSASRGVNVLIQDVRRASFHNFMQEAHPVREVIRLKRAGGIIEAEIIDAEIVERGTLCIHRI